MAWPRQFIDFIISEWLVKVVLFLQKDVSFHLLSIFSCWQVVRGSILRLTNWSWVSCLWFLNLTISHCTLDIATHLISYSIQFNLGNDCTWIASFFPSQAMPWMHWRAACLILTMFFKAGMLLLSIPALGFMLRAIVITVWLVCKLIFDFSLLFYNCLTTWWIIYLCLVSDLGNADLSGQLVSQLGQLTNLQYL